MPKQRTITTASGKRVPLASYIKGIKFAIANPEVEFKEGLTCWWPCTGAEIREQFILSIHDRINQDIPYSQRGL